MVSRLFIVEGVPCTGKTATSEWIATMLQKMGGTILHFPEGQNDHPADYDFHAYISSKVWQNFTSEEKEQLRQHSTTISQGYVIPLVNIQGDLFDKVIPYKIYDQLPWEVENSVILDKWAAFAEMAAGNEAIYVFDCCFLQNPLCETMMRFNIDPNDIFQFVSQIYDRISELNPVVIYLKNTRMKERIQRVSQEREQDWLSGVIEYHTSQGYGKSHGYTGFDGYVACLEARQERELAILNKLPIEKLVIENPYEDWEKTYSRLTEYVLEK